MVTYFKSFINVFPVFRTVRVFKITKDPCAIKKINFVVVHLPVLYCIIGIHGQRTSLTLRWILGITHSYFIQ